MLLFARLRIDEEFAARRIVSTNSPKDRTYTIQRDKKELLILVGIRCDIETLYTPRLAFYNQENVAMNKKIANKAKFSVLHPLLIKIVEFVNVVPIKVPDFF